MLSRLIGDGMRKALLAVAVVIVLIACLGLKPGYCAPKALSFIDGQEYYKAGEYAAAFSVFLELSEKGSPCAQSYLGLMYYNGLSVQKDYKKAAFWYKKSSLQGFYPSTSMLANMYINGEGVKKDCSKGISLHKSSSEAGVSMSSYTLYTMYENGLCVNKNTNIANKYLLKASLFDDEYGHLSMAIRLFYGIDDRIDYHSAKRILLDLPNNSTSQLYLYYIYEYGLGVKKDTARSLGYLRKSSDLGLAIADYQMSVEYYKGNRLGKDYEKAVHYALKSADRYSGSAYLLGIYCEKGFGVPVDTEQAEKWYQKAIVMGNPKAKKRLEALQ